MKLDSVDIYNIKLHETIYIEQSNFVGSIMRVAGGWIYERDIPDYRHSTATFVPFDNEFQRTNYE